MPKIPLPVSSTGVEDLPRTRRDLQNCFNTGEGQIVPRPGIESIASIDGVARGIFEWNDSLYQVQSTNLVRIDDVTTGSSTVIGTIDGIANVEVDFGFNEAVIVVKGGSIYSLSRSTTQIVISGVSEGITGSASFTHAGESPSIGDTVTLSGFTTNTTYNVENAIVTASTATTFDVGSIDFVADEAGQFVSVLKIISNKSNFLPCVDVTHINGRFVYIPEDGSPAFFSDIGNAGSVQALSFFDAEELPDKNNASFNGKNMLYVCGTDSIEIFRDTGASPNPFRRVDNARILNGYIGGLLEYNNTFLFIGKEKGQDQGIYSIVQGGAKKISNERIDTILDSYTVSELSTAISGRFKWRGYDIATFSLANHAFAFVGGSWFLLSTLVENVVQPWTIGFITQFNKTYYTAFSTKLGKLMKINTDYGDPIPRIIDTVLTQEADDRFTVQSIQLGLAQGFNPTKKSVAIQMSRDNVTYGPHIYKDTGEIGEYAKKIIWNPPGGLGNYEGFAGLRIYTTEDIDFSVDYLIVESR